MPSIWPIFYTFLSPKNPFASHHCLSLRFSPKSFHSWGVRVCSGISWFRPLDLVCVYEKYTSGAWQMGEAVHVWFSCVFMFECVLLRLNSQEEASCAFYRCQWLIWRNHRGICCGHSLLMKLLYSVFPWVCQWLNLLCNPRYLMLNYVLQQVNLSKGLVYVIFGEVKNFSIHQYLTVIKETAVTLQVQSPKGLIKPSLQLFHTTSFC